MARSDTDFLIFTPADVDLARSPLRASLNADTYVLGAFNPGLTRLPNGDLLLMVRVAEALREPIVGETIRTVRWTPDGYRADPHDLSNVDASDPRVFKFNDRHKPIIGLTSLSWQLPVRLTPDGREIVEVCYDKAITPQASYQDYGVEDARITKVGDTWYMTTCSVSAERHCTALYTSADGLNYALQGPVLDHQNKDMLIFEGLVGGKFWALTRPMGEVYFLYPNNSPYEAGPSINLASSPDALHWRPEPAPGIRARKGSTSSIKVGGGAQPILTDRGWLVLYHGVQRDDPGIGIYRTFWALLDAHDPGKILRLEDRQPLLEANRSLTGPIADQHYLTSDVVFTTGVVDAGDHYIVASGEADLACRITHLPKSVFD